ncbi:hypothetical protein [Halobellus rubicundus]|uniref:Uncharacterized protein n=1 Tax=Halobellus rubicundus TaxID=2996466 RepID=A0ABD5M8T7_9EURY
MDRQRAWGLGATLLGAAGLVALVAVGPAGTAASSASPRPYGIIALGGCLLLLTAGAATLVRARRSGT